MLIFVPEHFAGDKSNYITVSTAVFDILQQDHTALEGRLEYRINNIDWDLKPLIGVMANTDGAFMLYTGIFLDIPLTSFFSIIPSFAPGMYSKGESKDLHFALEFRSQIEFVLNLADQVRIGLSLSHISNASLGELNPGVESIAFNYHFPF